MRLIYAGPSIKKGRFTFRYDEGVVTFSTETVRQVDDITKLGMAARAAICATLRHRDVDAALIQHLGFVPANYFVHI